MSFISVRDVINMLKNFPEQKNVFNPWCQDDTMDLYKGEAIGRFHRLLDHFSTTDVKLVLMGEAPGYQGCHFSGMAFTSERLLIEGKIPRVLKPTYRITSRKLPWSEPSATIVWSALKTYGVEKHTVLWNAFPFHPHKEGDMYSNRKPTKEELQSTQHITRLILGLFPDAHVVAVGRVAEGLLKVIMGGNQCDSVRHPANGGAMKFSHDLYHLLVKYDLTAR